MSIWGAATRCRSNTRLRFLTSAMLCYIPRVNEPVSETAIDPRFRNRERQPGLDLLRALAIIVIVIYHAGIFGFALPGKWHRFGWVGVDLFFVLSGYLIGGQLLAPLDRGQGINLPRFFVRRALRILPAYFVILAIYFSLPDRKSTRLNSSHQI